MSDPFAARPFEKTTPKTSRLAVPADMVFYAALAGKAPEIDPSLADPMNAINEARREHPWSPMVLSVYLREICKQQALKIHTPEIAAWVHKQSVVARRRIHATHIRLKAIKNGHAA
jgi:hypothetical protein